MTPQCSLNGFQFLFIVLLLIMTLHVGGFWSLRVRFRWRVWSVHFFQIPVDFLLPQKIGGNGDESIFSKDWAILTVSHFLGEESF